MKEKEQTSISLKYVDSDVYEKIELLARTKNFTGKSKKDLIYFVLRDYINMHEIDEFKNPYLIQHIQSIIDAACAQTEKNIGGRLTKAMIENSINLGVTNRIVLYFLNKFGDNEETKKMLNNWRQEAVEDLRAGKSITYWSVLHSDKEDDNL